MTVPLFTTFCVLATATLALAAHRLLIVRAKGDECLHLLDADVPLIEQQKAAADKLHTLDTWGELLTVLTVLTGITTYVVWWLGF